MSILPFGLGEPETGQEGFSDSDLRYMGKRASHLYLSGVGSLNDHIVKIAQETPGMNRDHVQRVVEHSNVETFSTLFTKEGSDRHVEFDLADPKVIMTGLGLEKVATRDSSDYREPPANNQAAIRSAEADAILMGAFGVGDQIGRAHV